jgi:hypothetical protein
MYFCGVGEDGVYPSFGLRCASAPNHGAGSSSLGNVTHARGKTMNNIIYIVGLIVVILFILSFFGLR